MKEEIRGLGLLFPNPQNFMIIALLYSLANEKRIVINAIDKLVRITGLPKKEVTENLILIYEKINLKSITNSESGRKADLKLPTKGQLYQPLNHKEKELLIDIKDGKIIDKEILKLHEASRDAWEIWAYWVLTYGKLARQIGKLDRFLHATSRLFLPNNTAGVAQWLRCIDLWLKKDVRVEEFKNVITFASEEYKKWFEEGNGHRVESIPNLCKTQHRDFHTLQNAMESSKKKSVKKESYLERRIKEAQEERDGKESNESFSFESTKNVAGFIPAWQQAN